MTIAVAFALLVLGAGVTTLRCLGLAKGALAVGLAPPAGLAVLAVLSTWAGLLHAPAPVPGLITLALGLTGLSLTVRDRRSLMAATRTLWLDQRLAVGALVMALLVAGLALGLGFAGVQAPLSPHDGAFHVETIEQYRHAVAQRQWYPPGLAATFGAVLQAVPPADTAAGAFELALGLTLLAPIVTFGLGAAVWRDLRAAGAAALLVSFTYIFPYYPQVWGGWPQLEGLLLVIGLWIVATEYVQRPSWRATVLVGLLAGAILVVHGTELYTTTIVLLILAAATWRQLPWRRLPQDVGVALAIGMVCALPYLPALLHWAGTGGAYQVGLEDGTALDIGARSTTAAELLGVFTLNALGVDLPVRLVLIVLGVMWAFRQQTGGTLVAAVCVFVGLALTSSFLNGLAPVRTIYAATFPWSLPFRQMTIAAVPLAVIAGGGCVHAGCRWSAILARLHGVSLRRVRRVGRLLAVTWLVLTTWALVVFLSIGREKVNSFTTDDGAAMGWLHGHVQAGEVVANDGFADAGIWAPYKAGVTILEYRGFNDPATADERQRVLDHVAELDRDPAAQAAACALGVRYVYHGAQNSEWQKRQFPPLEALRRSSGLQEVFNSGDAVVFRTRLADC